MPMELRPKGSVSNEELYTFMQSKFDELKSSFIKEIKEKMKMMKKLLRFKEEVNSSQELH